MIGITILGLLIIGILLLFSSADRKLLLGKAQSMEVDGLTRTYRLYNSTDTGAQKTIIIALHNLGGDSRQMAYYSALQNDLTDDTVLVYPDAIKPQHEGERPGWNADFCCGSGWKNQVDDAKFIETLIDSLVTEYKPKNNKVAIVGFSNGAIFAHKLASEIPNKISGFVAVAGSIGVNDDEHTPTAPVPALLIHGQNDQTIKINGGTSEGEPDFNWKPLSYSQSAWEKANACSNPTTTETGMLRETRYATCKAPLIVQVNTQDSHQWPNWRLFNFWHKHSAGSQQITQFISTL